MRPSAADVDFDRARSARNGERDGKGNYFLWLSTALRPLASVKYTRGSPRPAAAGAVRKYDRGE